MNINLLLKISGLKSQGDQLNNLESGMQDIIQLLENLPDSVGEHPETRFIELHKDEPNQLSNKKDLLNSFVSVEKDMIKI